MFFVQVRRNNLYPEVQICLGYCGDGFSRIDYVIFICFVLISVGYGKKKEIDEIYQILVVQTKEKNKPDNWRPKAAKYTKEETYFIQSCI